MLSGAAVAASGASPSVSDGSGIRLQAGQAHAFRIRAGDRIALLEGALSDALGGGENHIGQVGESAVAAATLTRPAAATAYAAGQLVANSATAASVTPLALAVGRRSGGTGMIRRLRLSSSVPAAAGSAFRVHLFRSAPTSTAGDGAAFAGAVTGVAAIHLGYADVTLDMAFSDGAKGIASPGAGSEIVFDCAPGSASLYALIEARSAYASTAGETLTLALEVLRAGKTSRFAALSPRRIAVLEKLRRAAAQAALSNAYDAAAMASPPTITTSSSHSGTYSKTWPAVSGGAPNTGLFTFQGGSARISTYAASAVVFPAFTVAPGTTGSLSAVFSTDATANSGLAAIEFVTDAPTLEVELDPYRQQAGVKVIVDGLYASKTPTLLTTGGATAFLTLAFGSRARWHIGIETADFFYGVRTTPIDTVSPAPTAPDAVRAVMLWDSYGVGGGLPTPTDLTIAIPSILAHRIGAKDMRAPAIGGTGMLVSVVSSVTYNTFRQRVPSMLAYSPGADVVFAPMSLNDVYSGFTSAQIAAEAALLYAAIRAAYPDAFIVATGVSPKNSGPAASYTSAETAVAAAFNTWADPFSTFIPVATVASPWFTGTGSVGATNASGNCDAYLNSDGVHPAGEAGAAYYAGRLRDDYRRALAVASY